jgi:hypothetical protein
LLLPVIWLVAERQRAHTADSERERHTQQVLAFRRGGAGAGVRQMRTRKVGLAARRHAVIARVAALYAHWHTGTLQLDALLHMYVPCRSSVSLPSLDDD